MEVFLFVALFFIYLLTAFSVPDLILKRLWLLGFLLTFALTAVSVLLIGSTRQTVLMNENEINWYYVLYLFGSMSVILGMINLWIYRHSIWKMFFNHSDEDEFSK